MEAETRHPHPTVLIEVMTMAHYESVRSLWQNSQGVGLSAADERDRLPDYLDRNPNLSLVALDDGRVVGAVLCGHDGRRGFLHHLAVRKSHQRQGIGQSLVARALQGLAQAGIDKCHVFVFGDNQNTIQFWHNIGWGARPELVVLSSMTLKGKPLRAPETCGYSQK